MAPIPSNSDTEASIAQLQSISKIVPKDDGERQRLYEAANDLALGLEPPGDTIQRFVHMCLEPVAARIAGDLGLFDLLVKSSKPLSLEELTEKTSANPELLRRLLQHLASKRAIREVGVGLFTASNITKTLSRPAVMASIRFAQEQTLPCFQALPKFLADTNYQVPQDTHHSAFQLAHKTDLVPFEWILNQPTSYLQDFQQWMTVHHEGIKVWLDKYPFEQELCQNIGAETPVFVDIGGGMGHQCVLLKEKYPDLPGRIFLLDLPQVIQQAPPMKGVEKVAHDFWTTPPVKGAKAYYMRNIMHDYQDQKCIEILRHIMAAMSDDSVILIDEMVVPIKDAHWHVTSLDLTMMATLASTERTEKQWQTLFDSAGLKIVNIYTYTEQLQFSIMVAVPKGRDP